MATRYHFEQMVPSGIMFGFDTRFCIRQRVYWMGENSLLTLFKKLLQENTNE